MLWLQVELRAQSLRVIGACDPETYPLQKKRHTLEFLRTIAHLRPRTNTIGAVSRVRSALAFATHQFFRESGFQCVHTPVLSASDCEGAGEMFQVGRASPSVFRRPGLCLKSLYRCIEPSCVAVLGCPCLTHGSH